MYDILVVGSGLFGSIIAHKARLKKKKVLVIDKRGHIGGNCHTSKTDGIDVHVYGPHIFHTSNQKVWDFVNQFTKFNRFSYRPKVNFKGKIYSFPINLMTLNQLWGVTTPEEARSKLDSVKIHCDSPRNLEEWILSQVGQEVYETFIYGYTKKQWMRDPKDLPASIIKRIPIRLTYDDDYFDDTYQGIPIGGYTQIFENMLEGCDIGLGEDFFAKRNYWESIARQVVFTGRIDEYFGFCNGALEYRTLNFDHFKGTGDFQGNAVINYTEETVPHTRITEHKHFQLNELKQLVSTVWTRETPVIWTRDSVPYYPINDDLNNEIYRSYFEASQKVPHVLFGGRLAEYRYYDMHQVIGSALSKADRFIV